MMTIRSIAVTAAMFCACDGTTVEQEQRQDRQRLAQDQAEDRHALAQQQQDDRQKARQDAREELRGQTADLREERQDVVDEERDLSALMGRACAGVPIPELDACPLERSNVSSVRNIDDGVRVRITTLAGDTPAGNLETVQRNVDCYRARREVQAATRPTASAPAVVAATTRDRTPVLPVDLLPVAPTTAQPTCLLDMPELEIDVDGAGSNVDVTLTVPAGPRVLELRKRALDIADRRGASLR